VDKLISSELRRVSGRLKDFQEDSGFHLGLFSWSQPSGNVVADNTGLLLSDAQGFLNGDSGEISFYRSALWRLPVPALDEDGKSVCKAMYGNDGRPVLVDGQQIKAPLLTDDKWRGAVLVEEVRRSGKILLLEYMSTNQSESRLIPSRRALLDCFTEAGLAFQQSPRLLDLLWKDEPPSSSADPLLLWLSVIVELAHKGKLIGEQATPWVWWNWSAENRESEYQVCELLERSGERYDTSRRATKLHNPVIASSQAITWLMEQLKQDSTESFVTLARRAFSQAKNLGSSFEQAQYLHGLPEQQRFAPSQKYFDGMWQCLLSLRSVLQSPTTEQASTAIQLRKIVEIAREIKKKAGNDASIYSYYPNLNTIAWDGQQTLKPLQAAIDDPFYVLDPPTTKLKDEVLAPKKQPVTQEPQSSSSGASRRALITKPGNPLLRSSLKTVRQRFQSMSERFPPLAAMLVHQSGFESQPEPAWPEGFEQQGHKVLRIGSGPEYDPIVVVEGKLATTSLSRSREYRLYGKNKPNGSVWDYSDSLAEYIDAATEAGRILGQPIGRFRHNIWLDWEQGFQCRKHDDLWTNAVFELAWQSHIGSTLRADCWAWHHNSKLKIEDVAETSKSEMADLFSDLTERVGTPPSYWYSWLPNISRASLAAIDIILELLRKDNDSLAMSHRGEVDLSAETKPGTTMPNETSDDRPTLFISYSHQDEEFAKSLYGRLRANGFEVWYAVEDMKGGQKIHDQIDRAIQRHDRLLLILSEASMKSNWVETEIYKALNREREEGKRILFPIGLVDFNKIKAWECFDADSGKGMAREVREYFIPDFSEWKKDTQFEESFARLLTDLKENVSL